MAAQVQLIRRRDFGTDISSLSLLNYEDGFNLAHGGWIQAVTGGDAEVSEAMTLYVKASSHDDLAARLQSLDDKIREAGWYNDAAERYGVWLRVQLPDESEARQALVTGMRCEPAVSFYAPLVSPGSFVRGYDLALERAPWWESISCHIYLTTHLNCRGSIKNYGTTRGNEPSRIARTDFMGSQAGGPEAGEDPLYEFWMGFRTDRFGDRGNFVPVWDLSDERSTSYNDTTFDDDDSTAYGGGKWTCSFGTETELKRVSSVLAMHTSNYADQRGEYTVLLRAKVGAGTTCHVRLKDGFTYTSALRTHSRVKVDGTSWYLYALGTIKIPPSRGVVEVNFFQKYGFELYASRTAGSNNLDIDCLILIPRAEGFIHVSGGGVRYILGDTRPIVVSVQPDRGMDGWWYTLNMPYASVAVAPENYLLPVGAGAIVLAGQRETEHVLTDYVTVQMRTYPHWRTLRGDA